MEQRINDLESAGGINEAERKHLVKKIHEVESDLSNVAGHVSGLAEQAAYIAGRLEGKQPTTVNVSQTDQHISGEGAVGQVGENEHG